MNRTPIEIDINEWELFGGGFVADSYYKKNDDSVMMKLYQADYPPFLPYTELLVSEQVAGLGIPTAKAFEYIKAGDRYGAVFERVKNKRSIARILGDEPERAEEMGALFAEMVKKLHSTPCNTDVFSDMHEAARDRVKESPFLTESQRQTALAILDNTPKMTTCVHGDCNIGNVIIAPGRGPLYIDLGDFSYGNPLFDLGMGYFMANCLPDDSCLRLFHIHLDVMGEFWKSFTSHYFPGETLEEVNEKVRPYAGFQAVQFASKNNKSTPTLDATFEKSFGK